MSREESQLFLCWRESNRWHDSGPPVHAREAERHESSCAFQEEQVSLGSGE